MNQVKEILRLRWSQERTVREVARALGVSVGVVQKVTNRARDAGVTWDDVAALDEAALNVRLYGPKISSSRVERPEPDPVEIHKGLMRKGVTLQLLHLEYLEAYPRGLRYTAFCDRYRAWKKKRGVTMRQVHKAGQCAFVDFSGANPAYTDRKTGGRVEVEFFVSTLGASNLIYAEAVESQSAEAFVRANEHAFEYFGGVPETVVPDRLKAAIVDQDPYEPTVQRAFAEFARHYGTAVVPARSYKPRDKAKVEGAVLIAQRWILARIRNETFFSLGALNKRIAELVDELNDRPMKSYGDITRRRLFEEVEREALKPLPGRRFEPATWKRLTVNRDYHVAYADHFYSVPHRLVGEQVEARVTLNNVELFYVGQRVASHARSAEKYKHTTVVAHMPKNHREWAERDPAQLVDWGRSIGLHTETMVRRILERSPIPMQGWRSARGLKRLAEKYPAERIEEACRRALRFGAQSYRPVAHMLKTGLDLRPLPDEVAAQEAPVIDHEQVRGPDYYNN